VHSGERPLHALRERGVEYVEVRLMDLDPFESVGIAQSTMRMLDVFLLHCLQSDSPPDTPEEIAELKHNQHLAAERGREPGLHLQRGGRDVLLSDWAAQVLAECAPLAASLDQVHGTTDYSQALALAQARVQQPETTPSAQVLRTMVEQYDSSFMAFSLAQSQRARDSLLAMPWTPQQQAQALALAQESVAMQKAREAADTMPFEEWRERYMAPQGLG